MIFASKIANTFKEKKTVEENYIHQTSHHEDHYISRVAANYSNSVQSIFEYQFLGMSVVKFHFKIKKKGGSGRKLTYMVARTSWLIFQNNTYCFFFSFSTGQRTSKKTNCCDRSLVPRFSRRDRNQENIESPDEKVENNGKRRREKMEK